MATAHVARIALIRRQPITGELFVISGNKVDALGNKESPSPDLTINDVLNYEEEHRIIVDPDIPNSADNPTIKEYIEAESTSGFLFKHIDQYMIITEAP